MPRLVQVGNFIAVSGVQRFGKSLESRLGLFRRERVRNFQLKFRQRIAPIRRSFGDRSRATTAIRLRSAREHTQFFLGPRHRFGRVEVIFFSTARLKVPKSQLDRFQHRLGSAPFCHVPPRKLGIGRVAQCVNMAVSGPMSRK